MTQANLSINNQIFRLTSKYIDSIKGFPNSDDKNFHNKFRITVTNQNTNKRTYFNFYGSAHDYENRKKELSKKDLLYCFRCLIDDAISGIDSFEFFCSNFGYDSDSRTAERIYKECQKQIDKCQNIGIYEDDLYKIIEELSNRGVE